MQYTSNGIANSNMQYTSNGLANRNMQYTSNGFANSNMQYTWDAKILGRSSVAMVELPPSMVGLTSAKPLPPSRLLTLLGT